MQTGLCFSPSHVTRHLEEGLGLGRKPLKAENDQGFRVLGFAPTRNV